MYIYVLPSILFICTLYMYMYICVYMYNMLLVLLNITKINKIQIMFSKSFNLTYLVIILFNFTCLH